MKAVKINYSMVFFLVILLSVFCITGCDAENELENQEITIEPDEPETEIEPEGEAETLEEVDYIPGTSVAIYPGSEVVAESDHEIVYSTDATLDELHDFYNEYPDLRGVHISRTEEGFFLESELARIMRTSMSQEDFTEIVQEEVSKSGNLLDLVAMKIDSDEISNLISDEAISNLPNDGIILRFRFLVD